MPPVIPLPAHLPASSVAFEVEGTCMLPDIREGDYVIVDPHGTVHEGDIGVVSLASGMMVKKVHFTALGVRLVPSNPAHPEILTDDCIIVGPVIGVFRAI
jgi:SOS-response transcriptional repressor LexA